MGGSAMRTAPVRSRTFTAWPSHWPCRTGSAQVEQVQAGALVVDAAHVQALGPQPDLEGGVHPRLLHVAADHRVVRPAEYAVDVQEGLAVLQRGVALEA